MVNRIHLLVAALVSISAAAGPAGAQDRAMDDAKRGAANYRACASCHSLDPGVHLTGPSLAGLWGKTAASVADFPRYSKALRSQRFIWDATTLDAWIANPQAFVAGNAMTFRGIDDARVRRELVAFLKLALAPGGAKSVVASGLIPAQFARGQIPENLGQAGPAAQVASVRHCKNSFFIVTADGAEHVFWELNLRLKVDSGPSGPKGKLPVLTESGMQGDRASLVFARPDQIGAFVKSAC